MFSNKHIVRVLLVNMALILCLGANAQSFVNLEVAEGEASLFRGPLPKTYPFKYNGTYFWSRNGFYKGDVFYNGKRYDGVFLNFDAYRNELLVCVTEQSTPIAVFVDQVAWFTMEEQRFLNLRYLGHQDAPNGIFEVIRDGKTPLLRKVRKLLYSDGNNHNGNPIGYQDPKYDVSVNSYFKILETFYVLDGDKIHRISKKGLKKRLKQPAGEPTLGELTVAWHPESEKATTGPVLTGTLPGTGTGLPTGYFELEKEDSLSVVYEESVTASYKNKVYSIGTSSRSRPGKKTIKGVIIEYESDEPLAGVVVYDDSTSTYVRSDSKGRYRIQLPQGQNVLNFSAESKEPLSLQVNILSDGNFNVMMAEKVTMLKESFISSENISNHRTTTLGIERLGVKTLNKIPTPFGEGDVLKAIMTLPGVKSSGEASSGFNVRGGSADQNLILFNGSTIYYPTHMFGILSAFNPDLISDVELYKSSIPVEYGGRVSSVLNVRSREGDFLRWKGSAGIGPMTSRLHLEGPLKRGKTSIAAGARISYSDWMLGLLPQNSDYAGGSANFMDANFGITHRFNQNNTLQAFGYYAKDKFIFGGDTTFNYTSYNASLLFKHKDTEGGSLDISTGYDQYNNMVAVYGWDQGSYDLSTYIRQVFIKANRVRPVGTSHKIDYGVHLLGYALDPGIMRPYAAVSNVIPDTLKREYGLEPAVFVSDTWNISDKFSLEGGIRMTGFYGLESNTYYYGPEFRLSGKYSLADNFSIKGGLNTMRQNIHLISNTSSISPMDTWRLSSDKIKPTTGWQGAGGAYWTHLATGIEISAEAYYKEADNHLDYKPGATLSMNDKIHQDLAPVFLRSYGIELMARKTNGKLTGWLSYSYSRAKYKEMQDRGYETIAHGRWYNAPYDKPHEAKLVGNFAFTRRYSLSVNVDYSTGRPVTVPYGSYLYDGVWRMAYSERNFYRIPDYFRMDVAVNIDPGHSLVARMHTTINIGVYNITGRKNPYSVFFDAGIQDTGFRATPKGHLLSVFAVPVPFINLNLSF